MENQIALFRNFGLATPSRFSYSQEMNAITGNGFTSAMGNSYFNALRFAEGLLIKEDVGFGGMYNRTFLNGLRIFDLRTRKLLAEKIYPMYEGALYSKEVVKSVTRRLLSNLILQEAKEQGYFVTESEVERQLSNFLDCAFSKDQLQEMENNVKAIGF